MTYPSVADVHEREQGRLLGGLQIALWLCGCHAAVQGVVHRRHHLVQGDLPVVIGVECQAAGWRTHPEGDIDTLDQVIDGYPPVATAVAGAGECAVGVAAIAADGVAVLALLEQPRDRAVSTHIELAGVRARVAVVGVAVIACLAGADEAVAAAG